MAETKKKGAPTKACPGCGKPIHARKMNHEECGWTAKTMPAAAKVTKPKATAAKNGKAISKMEAVRQILAESGNDTKPLEIEDQLKKKYGLKMAVSVISNYKSVILKKGAKKAGRPKGSTNTAKPTTVSAAKTSSAISVEDIRAVKKLIDAIGAEKVKELAGVLAN